MYPLEDLKGKLTLWSMDYRINVVLMGITTLTLYVHLHQSSCVTRGIANEQHILKGIISPEQYFSTVGLKYALNHIVNRGAAIQALSFHF